MTPGEMIKERIKEAARVDRAMPNPYPASYRSAWPDMLREPGDVPDMTSMRPKPTAAEIARMDEVFKWLRWLPVPEQRILWGRGMGLPWRQIALHAGVSVGTAQRWHGKAVEQIVRRKMFRVCRPMPEIRVMSVGR